MTWLGFADPAGVKPIFSLPAFIERVLKEFSQGRKESGA
jgi:hypothetical protein